MCSASRSLWILFGCSVDEASLVDMPDSARPSQLWSDRDYELPRGRFRNYQKHHVFKTRAIPVRRSKPVPLTGAYAGLSPKRLSLKGSDGMGGPAALRAQAEAWLAEAAAMEKNVKGLSLEQQVGLGLVTQSISVKVLVKGWDPEGRGSIVKSEFRMRFRGLLERLALIYPGTKPIDEIFEKHDGGARLSAEIGS